MSFLAGLAATVIILPFLISINAFSHAIAYDFSPPSEQTTSSHVQPKADFWNSVTSTFRFHKEEVSNRPTATADQSVGAWGWVPVIVFLTISVLFSVLAGGGWKGSARIFVNRTSLHPLYAARLIRAYLGASNNLRYGTKVPGVTDPVEGDDIAQEDYWRPKDDGCWKKGAPLHLVNVTINETIDGRSQTEQRDRKGVGLAVGPAGISVGVQHHVVIEPDGKPSCYEIYPRPETGDFRVFAPDQDDDHFAGQPLSLGNWTAISGAAVSTGLGSLNSLGISLLAGFFNLRLGYWWDSGTKSITTGTSINRWIGKAFAFLLPAQASLMDEFLGRFRGTVRKYWYLTDGGHFENLGAYELIRRRLPLIVVIDAAGDPEYNFEDLANVIRKARLDFNAEIAFLNPEKEPESFQKATAYVASYFKDSQIKLFGSLNQLRRGKWAAEPVPERKAFFKSVREDGLSLRHAALAKITYLDEPHRVCHLLLIKPTLIGEEPEDLINYHLAHPSFPHETTADQFFDEAQWESYRRLGQHIAEKLFNIA